MEHFCSKCDTSDIRPVGRRCFRTGMATNITSQQTAVAVNALLTQQTAGRPPSPIQAGPSGSTVTGNSSTTVITTMNSQPQQGNLRTEDLILAELQKLSARMTQVEQELHTDTFTSTPRKRKKTTRNRQANDTSLFGTVNRTEAYTSLEESMALPRASEGVRIPVHTHSNSTTSTTTASLFSQVHQAHTQQGMGGTVNTQMVFSTCRTSNHTHQVRAVPGSVMFATTQRGPVMSTTTQGTGLSVAGMTRPVGANNNTPVTTAMQPPINTPCQVTAVNALQASQSTQNVVQQPQTQEIYMPGSHLPAHASLAAPGAMHVGPLPHSQLNYAAVQHTNNPVGNPEHPIIPSIQALKTTAVNQDLVQQRLQELNHLALPQHQGNQLHYNLPQSYPPQVPNKVKGKKEKVEVVWPQDCAFVGHLRARVSYQQLTQAQFILGFLRSVQEEQDVHIKGNMIEYLTELFQNVCDHSWQAAKGAHLVVMTKMEEGLVAWSDLKKVNKVRKTYVRATSNPSSSQSENNNNSSKKGSRKPSSIACKE